MVPIYLDNAATTRVLPEVVEAMASAAAESFANPSSLHGAGAAARRVVDQARSVVARALGVDEAEVLFTSGGTEANNLAIRGLPRLRAGDRALLSAVEHPSVFAQRAWLEDRGVRVDLLPVAPASGQLATGPLEAALDPTVRLVAVMRVNNETGAVQPVADVVRRVRAISPEAHVHCDAVQAFGKSPVRPRDWGVDSLSISAHKIHGPKGVGALYLRRGLGLRPLVGGGSQERGLRPGTENVPGIAGFAAAVRLMEREAGAFLGRVEAERRLFLAALPERIEGAAPLVDPSASAPYVVAIRVPGCASETLLHFLEREGVYVSSGSACHAESADLSHVLRALGYAEDPGSLRASLALDSPEGALDALLDALERAVDPVREVTRSRRR